MSIPTRAPTASDVVERRIIVERRAKTDSWIAWFQDEPASGVEDSEATKAFDQLIAASRARLPDPYQLRVDDRRSRGGHIEVVLVGKVRPIKPCPDCKGSGQYVGLAVVEPCAMCQGQGTVPA